MTDQNLPLPQFLSQTLHLLLPYFTDDLSTSSTSAQAELARGLDNLHLIGRMITSLGVFSSNEGIEEVGDGEMVFMALGWVVGTAEGMLGTGDLGERKRALGRADAAFHGFVALLQSYAVLSAEEKEEAAALAEGPRAAPKDPARRREEKIRQYKREKELRQRISASIPGAPAASSSPLNYIIALLPSSSSSTSSRASVDPEDNSDLREPTLLLLRLLYTLTLSALASNSMELDLLASVATSDQPSSSTQPPSADEEDTTWRLDRAPAGAVKPRELISGGGRVLRPFTILPSTTNLSERERIRGEVFRADHRLPTMTIDEYLEEERRRGNIITGGGQASYDAPTASELLALEAENDGTAAADEADEQKRSKEENWARFTEENKKGAGNTMNRG